MSTKTLWTKARRYVLASSLGLLLPLGLNGCQTALESGPLITDQSYWQGMQERLQQIKSVQLRGNVSIAYKSDRFSTNFVYRSTAPCTYSLLLVSSLGSQLADLKVTPEAAVLIADNHTFTAQSPQELFAQVTKIPLPLDDFQSIIIGKALPSSTFTSNGILRTTTLPDFQVAYNDYLSLPESQLSLPKEIEVLGPNLRLVVKTRAVEKLEL